MPSGYLKEPTQEKRVLNVLREAKGAPVDGMTFLRLERPITQYHARIWGLQKQGYKIEPVDIPGKSWKAYRLLEEPEQNKLFL